MKIADAKVYVCSPSRNFVTLKIMTDEGAWGLGDATLNGREKCSGFLFGRPLFPILKLVEIHQMLKTSGSSFIGERIGVGARSP